MHLEQRLRQIQTNRANLAHGRLPQRAESRFPARPACSGGTNLFGLAMSGVLSNIADVPTGHKYELQMRQ